MRFVTLLCELDNRELEKRFLKWRILRCRCVSNYA